MSRRESAELAAIDDISAALDIQRECVAILAERGRSKLNKADLAELEEILAAADRIRNYVQALRTSVSAAYQRKAGE